MKIQDLTISERIMLAEELWDSVVSSGADIEVTESQKRELDKRLATYELDQEAGSVWQEVKDRITSGK